MQNRQDHFAYCVQLFGGVTSYARRLRIDERAIRRFINGERPITDGLMHDTAKALRELAAQSTEAAETIANEVPSEPNNS